MIIFPIPSISSSLETSTLAVISSSSRLPGNTRFWNKSGYNQKLNLNNLILACYDVLENVKRF